MDVAYDKVQEDAYPEDAPPQDAQQKRERTMSNDLNTEVKEALTAFQNSSWGSSLGGLWGAVKKQVWKFVAALQCSLADASAYRASRTLKEHERSSQLPMSRRPRKGLQT